jgi:hypothetical protein
VKKFGQNSKPLNPIAKKSPNISNFGNIYKGRYSTFGNYLQGEIFHIRELSTRGDIPHSGNTDLIRCFTQFWRFGDK